MPGICRRACPTSFATTPVAGKTANAAVVSGTVLIELPSAHSFAPLHRRTGGTGARGGQPHQGRDRGRPDGLHRGHDEGHAASGQRGQLQPRPRQRPADAPERHPLGLDLHHRADDGQAGASASQARAPAVRDPADEPAPAHASGERRRRLAATAAGRRARESCGRSAAPHKGLFRTIGANSITTVENATWIVSDRCDGTLTEVGRGKATVTPIHPTHKHEHPVTITAGQGVLIKGRFV